MPSDRNDDILKAHGVWDALVAKLEQELAEVEKEQERVERYRERDDGLVTRI